MKVVLASPSGDTTTIDVTEDLPLSALKELAKADIAPTASDVRLSAEGKILGDMSQTVTAAGIKEGDVVLVASVPSSSSLPANSSGSTTAIPNLSIDFSSIQVPSTSAASSSRSGGQPSERGGNVNSAHSNGSGPPQENDAATLREQFINDPHTMSLLKERNPALADAVVKGDLEKMQHLLDTAHKARVDAEQMYLRALNADAFDMEAQQYIEEKIMQSNLDSMLEHAMEHNPEVFGTVTMLYINAKVNGHPVKAFVDSGAQSTIISSSYARRCNIMRLVDKRFSGLARGVGTQKIIGKVHLAQLQIESDFLSTSFIVLEDQTMDMLLGLDMLKSHQCLIDLQKNELKIGTTGTTTKFLAESDLPAHARSHAFEFSDGRMDTDDGQGGSGSSLHNNSSGGDQTNFPEEHVTRMVEMGFSRDVVIKALRDSRGDVQMAIAALLAKSIQVPQ